MWELATRKNPWYELGAIDYLDMFSKLDVALRDGRRPFLPPAFAERHALFADTMRDCWSEDPTLRPTFDEVTIAPPIQLLFCDILPFIVSDHNIESECEHHKYQIAGG